MIIVVQFILAACAAHVQFLPYNFYRISLEVPPPRYKGMKPDQEWTDVWPAAHSFKWSVVPLPIRQGYVERSENENIPPGKYANAELMKIPNFLHLTPNHVRKQCAAIKQFCNRWPEGLKSDDACDEHFPVEVTTRDYVVDSASLRDPRARVVTVKVKLSSLDLDDHAQDKLVRLAGQRYDPETDVLTIETDQCPLKRQNYDYAMYLVTALYTESWKTEAWECEKTLADMEKYFWDLNQSKTTIIGMLSAMKQQSQDITAEERRVPSCVDALPKDPTPEQIVRLPEVEDYKNAVTKLFNDGESIKALEHYKEAVKRLVLNVKQQKPSTMGTNVGTV